MKDLTDYFLSPTKARTSSEEVKNAKPTPEVNCDQNVNTENKLKQNPDPPESVKETGKMRKRKKRRKPTDPEVRNVTELLTNNLNLTSPNSSRDNVRPHSPIGGGKTISINLITSTENESAENNKNTPKVNAFQFLMNSRNNVIGQNSEGKDSKDDASLTEDKQKLEARKNLFKNWADQKGGSKRKREEENVDKIINFKMENRAKRLKKLLQGEQKSKVNQKRRKRVKKLSSSESENSNDLNVVNNEIPLIEITDIIEENARDIEISNCSSSPIKPRKENGQNNLLNFLGIINKEDAIEVFDESDQKSTKDIIKIKMFTPKNNKKKVNCIITDDSSQGENKAKRKKKKHKTKDKLNDSMEEFSSPPDNKKTKSKKIHHRKDARENLSEESAVTLIVKDDSEDDLSISKRITRKKKRQNSAEKKQDNICEGRTLRKRTIIDYKSKMTPEISKSAKNSKKNQSDSIEKIQLSSDSEYEESIKKKPTTSLKVAPVFLKSTPKPKVDPNIMEARNKFLMSGIPDSLKKTIEKQRSVEDKEYDVFPSISHVQQKCGSNLWDLLPVNLSFAKQPSPISLQPLKCEGLIIKTVPYEVNLTTEVNKVKHLKKYLQEIKSQNPNYPVFKVFRHIYEKSGKNSKKTPKKKSKRKSAEIQESRSDLISKDHEMWTEKYNPRSSEEILGNYRSLSDLRKWLETWMLYSQEINARKRRNSNSESEFESTDCDSRDSSRLPGNTMILYGPCGSGKTSAVYAIANELGFNVLELNASTKRTGKRLLQELQEATQSHQVRKAKINLTKTKSNSETKKNDQKHTKKMCILLLEDIDLIFEQDEGFLSSLSQLIGTSKRPIILTTTDKSPLHVQKFISQYECISFMPLSLQCLAIWLQIVCLVEGLIVDKNDVGNLLEYNKGDIRKTLLEMQFWCQSGGQLEKNRVFPLNCGNTVGYLKAPDEELLIELAQEEATKEMFVHKHCISSFEIFRINEEYSIPLNIDLGLLWWNFPNILDVSSGVYERLGRQYNTPLHCQDSSNNEPIKDNELVKLKSLLNLYDSFIGADIVFKRLECPYSNEPVIKNWSTEILDTLELTERVDDCNNVAVKDLACDLSHNLINGCVENYKTLWGTSCSLNMALPDASERRWRANQHMGEDFLKALVPLSNILDRKSVALDYLPVVREIARSEERRAATNTKRGNRFRHYLRDFDVDFKQSTCKLACNILNIE